VISRDGRKAKRQMIVTKVSDLLVHPPNAARTQRGWTLADVAVAARRPSGLTMAARQATLWRCHGVPDSGDGIQGVC
jgi:hypothetical protein